VLCWCVMPALTSVSRALDRPQATCGLGGGRPWTDLDAVARRQSCGSYHDGRDLRGRDTTAGARWRQRRHCGVRVPCVARFWSNVAMASEHVEVAPLVSRRAVPAVRMVNRCLSGVSCRWRVFDALLDREFSSCPIWRSSPVGTPGAGLNSTVW